MKHFLSPSLVMQAAIVIFIFAGNSCSKSTVNTRAPDTALPSQIVPTLNNRQMANTIVNAVSATPAPQNKPRDEKQGSAFQLQNVTTEIFAKTSAISNPYNSQFSPIKPYARLTPLDFKIGELLDYDSLGKDERLILSTLVDFIESLKKGEIKKETIEETEYMKIFRVVSPSLADAAPVDYRIGKIKMAGKEDAAVPVRVYGKAGSTYGSVYFSKKESSWYITDVQIDFSAYEPSNGSEKFMPSTYNNWMY